jgi:hypothetical protein
MGSEEDEDRVGRHFMEDGFAELLGLEVLGTSETETLLVVTTVVKEKRLSWHDTAHGDFVFQQPARPRLPQSLRAGSRDQPISAGLGPGASTPGAWPASRRRTAASAGDRPTV